jgi:hypothetical protein
MFFFLVLLMFKGSSWETSRVDLRAAGLTFKFKKRQSAFHPLGQRSVNIRDARQ